MLNHSSTVYNYEILGPDVITLSVDPDSLGSSDLANLN